jgi:hypothetical protein
MSLEMAVHSLSLRQTCDEHFHEYIYIYKTVNTTDKQLTHHHIMSIEFINYVKITQHVSAHLEPSSGNTLFKAIKY